MQAFFTVLRACLQSLRWLPWQNVSENICLDRESKKMFPLPLTPMEEYFLRDDRPDYPMTGVCRLRFSGFFDHGHFHAALASVAERHPLVRATVEQKRFGTPRWMVTPDRFPAVYWDVAPTETGFPPLPFMDLEREIGARFHVVRRETGHDLIAQIHHCCSDAQGLVTLLEDLMTEYAQRRGSIEISAPPRKLEPERLLRRGAPMLTGWRFLKMLHKQAVGLRGVLRFIRNTPVPLAPRKRGADTPVREDLIQNPLTFELNRSETRALFAAARKASVNASDILVRDLFLAVFDWRRNHSQGNDADCLRISIPISLRGAADLRMPMANSFSMIFLDRQASLFADPHLLLRSIHEQMRTIKENQLQYTFLLSLGLARKLPGGLSNFTAKDICHATSCFSNIGPVFLQSPLPRRDGKLVMGDMCLESMDFVLPLRPHMHAAICSHIYGGCLRLLINYDPRNISGDAARDLLEGCIGRIHRTAAVRG
jgi:hypothetical protein